MKVPFRFLLESSCGKSTRSFETDSEALPAFNEVYFAPTDILLSVLTGRLLVPVRSFLSALARIVKFFRFILRELLLLIFSLGKDG